MPKISTSKLDRLLVLGDFTGIKAAVDAKLTDIWYLIAAEVFLGNLEEAEATFEKFKDRLSIDHISAALFFLLIGKTRKSEYISAHKILQQQKSLALQVNNPYFIYQSYAFLHFFYNHFSKTRKYAEKSLAAATQQDFTFGKILSYDLLGHTLVQLGEVEQGKRLLTTARETCLRVGNSKLAESIETSILKFTCNFSDRLTDSLELIEQKIQSLTVQDTYSKSELLLEKSRLLLLLGKASLSQTVLEQAGELIFKFRHKRHSAILNLRYAYLSWVQGDNIKAMTLLLAAQSLLNPNIDKVLELKIKGLQSKISHDEAVLQEVKQLSQQLGIPLALRILARDTEQAYPIPRGEDRLGDLIDDIKAGKGFDKVLKESALGLLQHAIPKPGKFLLLDIVPGFIVIWNYGNAVAIDARKSQLPRNILLLLAKGAFSKEQVIQKVWGYEYDPLRHDSLIYQTMKNVRIEIGANLLETIDGKYQLNGIYEILSFNQKPMDHLVEQVSMTVATTPSAAVDANLNYRQNLFLQTIKVNEFMSPQDYAKKFKISRITASRDLNELLKSNKVSGIGKGRSVRYLKVIS